MIAVRKAWTGVMIGAIGVLTAMAIAPATPAFAQDAEPDPIIETERDDPAMTKARSDARATLDQWLAVLDDPPFGTSYIEFKFPLEGWEHIWVGNVTRDGDYVEGQLANAPHSEGYSLGDRVRVPISEISDWSYTDIDNYTHGQYSTRALFPRMSPEQVAEIKAMFGWE